MNESIGLGIVIPAYCESENLVSLCDEINSILVNAQIVIVDDSPDLKSAELIEKRKFNNVKFIHRGRKLGRGTAVIEGLKFLKTKQLDYYFEMDADFSHKPTEMPSLLQAALNEKADLTIASRYIAGGQISNWPIQRRILSKVSNVVAKGILRIPASDYTNGFRLYSDRAVGEIILSCGRIGSGFIALSEILVCLHGRGFKLSERPSHFVNRARGESSMSFGEIFNAIRALFHLYFYKKSLKNENIVRRS